MREAELNYHSVFSLQKACILNHASAVDMAHHIGRKMSKQNSRQKNFEGKMTDYGGTLTFSPQSEASSWISAYHQARLLQKDEASGDVYLRILRQFTAWVIPRPGQGKQFLPEQLMRTVVEVYFASLQEMGYRVSHGTRVKVVIKQFCQWLIDEQDLLERNPTSGIGIHAEQRFAPRMLFSDQRFVLRNLNEKSRGLRGKTLFALGY
jgi:site-specific recombinase XerD